MRADTRCEIDGFPLRIELGSYGQTLTFCDGCDRRRAGQCMNCGAPVQGRSWRCEFHKRERRVLDTRKSERRNREKRLAAGRRRYRAMSPDRKAKRIADKKRWREEHPLRVKLSKRKGRLDGTWGYTTREKYLEAQAEQNARRVERKREQMRELCRLRSPYRDHGPTCRQCGAEVPFAGVGRPRLDCFECRPALSAAS